MEKEEVSTAVGRLQEALQRIEIDCVHGAAALALIFVLLVPIEHIDDRGKKREERAVHAINFDAL